MQKDQVSSHKYLDILAALFITVLIVSNIASVKLAGVGFLVFDAGTILFPLAYILGDVITEIYGFKRMRRLLVIGIIMLILTSLVSWVVGALPPAADWGGQEAFEATIGVVWRIVLASITAIFVGELLNAYVLAKLKVRFGGKYLWGRLMGSSVVGNAADTLIFSVIAFAGTVSASVLFQLIGTVFAIKMVAEIIVSPLTVRIIAWLKRREVHIAPAEEPKLLA